MKLRATLSISHTVEIDIEDGMSDYDIRRLLEEEFVAEVGINDPMIITCESRPDLED